MNTAQTQLMLRVEEPRLAARVSRALEEGKEMALEPENSGDETESVSAENFTSRRFRFALGDEKYAARLVNLPTMVETHKVDDNALYKCGDVSQLVLVYESEARRGADETRRPPERAWRTVYPDGLTAPNKDVVSRRFTRSRRRKSRVEASREEIAFVESYLLDLAKQEPVEDEQITEDIVPFEDWMTTVDHPLGATFADDNPLAARRPWVFVPNKTQHEEVGFSGAHHLDDSRHQPRHSPLHAAAPSSSEQQQVVGRTDDRARGSSSSSSQQQQQQQLQQQQREQQRSATLSPAARAADEKRLAFVARRDDVARDLKATQLRIQALDPKAPAADQPPKDAAVEQELQELHGKNRRLLLELNQLDEKLLNCEIEAATLASS